MAVLFLGDHPGRSGLVGAFLVIAGVLVISTGTLAGEGTSPARRRAGIGYGVLAPYALRGKAEVAGLWRHHRRQVMIIGVLSPVGYLLVLFALRIAPVSLVAPTREVSIVLGGLAAWRTLGEAHAVRRLTGSLVVAGITAIAMA